ncbi:MAG: hypothetical protein K6T75_06575 [Acetobacteraceae bacterium]|nr:hypothetical protein [Acetobacteraceae bacterium]
MSHELILNVAESRLEYQRSSLEASDVKTGVLLGAQAVLLSLLFSAAGPISPLTLIAGSLLLLSFLLALLAYLAGPFRCDPNPAALFAKYCDEPPAEIRYAVLYQVVDAYSRNQVILQRKESLIRWSMGILVVALLAVVFARALWRY